MNGKDRLGKMEWPDLEFRDRWRLKRRSKVDVDHANARRDLSVHNVGEAASSISAVNVTVRGGARLRRAKTRSVMRNSPLVFRIANTVFCLANTPDCIEDTPVRLATLMLRATHTPFRIADTIFRIEEATDCIANIPDRVADTPDRVADTT